METTIKVEPSFQLKGSLFTLSVLQLKDTDLEKLSREIQDKIRLAPKFFHFAPAVIDLSKLAKDATLNFAELAEVLRKHKLVPVGVRGGSSETQTKAHQAGFAVMIEPNTQEKNQPNLANKKTVAAHTTAPTAPKGMEMPKAPKNKKSGTTLVTQPIRSGQQVYAQGGDLVVVASVSPGAELLADGNIHVYGTLRGRALAGINGNEDARIFCNQLEAELVAIAGHYKVFENLTSDDGDYYKQLYLEDGQLIISSL